MAIKNKVVEQQVMDHMDIVAEELIRELGSMSPTKTKLGPEDPGLINAKK